MAVIVWGVDQLSIFSYDIITLLIQIVSGILIYIIGSRIFHLETFEYILGYLKKIMKKKE